MVFLANFNARASISIDAAILIAWHITHAIDESITGSAGRGFFAFKPGFSAFLDLKVAVALVDIAC